MDEKLNNLRKEIINNSNKKSTELFQGANLIITDQKIRNSKAQDIVVYSDKASELSWLVFKLKDYFKDEIDYVNKYSFYTHVGELINESIIKKLSLKDQMLYVIDNLGGFLKKIK